MLRRTTQAGKCQSKYILNTTVYLFVRDFILSSIAYSVQCDLRSIKVIAIRYMNFEISLLYVYTRTHISTKDTAAQRKKRETSRKLLLTFSQKNGNSWLRRVTNLGYSITKWWLEREREAYHPSSRPLFVVHRQKYNYPADSSVSWPVVRTLLVTRLRTHFDIYM